MIKELFKFGFNQRPVVFCILHGMVFLANTAIPLFTDQYHFAIPLMSIAIEAIYWVHTIKQFNR